MRLRIGRFVVFVAFVACAGPATAQAPGDSPEQAVRDFMYALYANDTVDFQKRILPEPDSGAMIGRQTLAQEQLDKLRKDISALQLRQTAPPSFDGKPLADSSAPPTGAKIVYFTQFRGVVMAVPLQRTDTGWKVDVRFWLAMRKQATTRPQMTDPEMVAKGFLFHILAKKPESLNQFAAQPLNAEEYTSANNLPPGDLDHILSLCVEMPIVRARQGERVVLPSGEMAVGSDNAGSNNDEPLVLIGLMGFTEIPFLMRRVGGAWKVVPQKYFEMLRKAGDI
jgi:hypothetical protein